MLLSTLAYLAIFVLIWPLSATRFCATLLMLFAFTVATNTITP
jgi:hypothetical protein